MENIKLYRWLSMDNIRLREIYVKFQHQLNYKKKFDEELYDALFDALSFQIKQWVVDDSVPIRAFEVCIDLVYVLSNERIGGTQRCKERAAGAKDEVYGLLMRFD